MELVVLVVVSLVAAAAAMRGAEAVQFITINNATGTRGGVRFDKEISFSHSRRVLRQASSFVLNTFKETEKERKKVEQVTLILEPMEAVAFASGATIHLNADYVARYAGNGGLRAEVEGILYHEVTHLWQRNGGGKAPGGLIEGIADYMRLKAGYAASHWVKAGEGEKWDQGYDVTARFLEYCDGLRRGQGSFVARLNHGMRDDYSEQLFVGLLGKTVDALWKDYKNFYGN